MQVAENFSSISNEGKKRTEKAPPNKGNKHKIQPSPLRPRSVSLSLMAPNPRPIWRKLSCAPPCCRNATSPLQDCQSTTQCLDAVKLVYIDRLPKVELDCAVNSDTPSVTLSSA
ncbi:hypothetical protein GWI33_022209 [Rhynchophorus ferrugineus]|uniref:Uncharacterized protein n=1 Tax=Rhynchophorus ferrugineus TaxID=354439 RepID=A0A834MHV0_RHYFE|nr:hypothetical protein GWI33_022209 [Rhynchophorus ferrugineus]